MAENAKPPVEGKSSWDDEKWNAEKREFGRQAMKQALTFMEMDNQIIGHFAIITGALAVYVREHPKAIIELAQQRAGGAPPSTAPGEVSGGDLWDDLLGMIETIVVDDKKFFLDLISRVLGL